MLRTPSLLTLFCFGIRLRLLSCGIAAGPRPRRSHRVHRNVLANGLPLYAHRLRHRAKVAGSGTHRGKMGERSALGIARAANPSELHAGGMYERHLRRLRKKNTARRSALLESVANYLGDRVEVTGDGAGAQVVLWPRKKVVEQEVVEAAALRGVSNRANCA
jgi:hypothetical protein